MTTTQHPSWGAAAERTARAGVNEHIVRLRDGRRLCYAEYGDPAETPVMFFHGFPGSRLSGALADDAGRGLAVRIIATDRPGAGRSDPQPKRTFLDWTSDVAELADALAIDRFAVAGISGGGPYVAACAYALPERVTAGAIISGVGPFEAPGATDGMSRQNRTLFWLSRRAPWLVAPPMLLLSELTKRAPDWTMTQLKKALPEADRRVLERPEIEEMFREDSAEATRQGVRPAVQESVMYARPWGFPLEGIRVPMYVWQGGMDKNVAPSMGRYQASVIPGCRLTFYEDEGHLLGVPHIDEILTAITGR